METRLGDVGECALQGRRRARGRGRVLFSLYETDHRNMLIFSLAVALATPVPVQISGCRLLTTGTPLCVGRCSHDLPLCSDLPSSMASRTLSASADK